MQILSAKLTSRDASTYMDRGDGKKFRSVPVVPRQGKGEFSSSPAATLEMERPTIWMRGHKGGTLAMPGTPGLAMEEGRQIYVL
jgi:hypothetical protein